MIRRASRLCDAIDLIHKDIANVIGVQKMLLLRDWRKAFDKEFLGMVEFDKVQKSRDNTCTLFIRVKHHSIGLMVHYSKIIILERLAVITQGSRFVTDLKVSNG